MSAKVNRAITLEEGRSPERANRRHSGSCASRSRSRSDWRRASSANPILPSEPRRKMRCNADQLAHRLRSKPPRPRQLAGKNCRFFPSKREFRRFSPRNRRLAAKMVQKIKSLLANSRGEANRGFASAEPGNCREDRANLGVVHDGRAPKENQKETQLFTPRNALNINHLSQQSYRESRPFVRRISRATSETRVPGVVAGAGHDRRPPREKSARGSGTSRRVSGNRAAAIRGRQRRCGHAARG